MKIVDNSWKDFFEAEFKKDYIKTLKNKLEERKNDGAIIYPKEDNIFEVYKMVDVKDVKVVIIGQDPYHGENQAHGLAFSVNEGIKIPPSLKNMYKELENSVEGFTMPNHGYLKKWSEQGVFLLNNVLTVEQASPDSHKKFGWEIFTDNTIKYIDENCDDVVFVLWGGNAKKKTKLLNKNKNLILTAAHPSPLSVYRGFYGCNHFNLINEYLVSKSRKPIDWKI